MTRAKDGLDRYRAALTTLAEAKRDGRVLAEVWAFYVGQLRGQAADLDGPLPSAIPTPADVLEALRRIDRARIDVEREWDWLSDKAKEEMPSPDAIIDVGD